MNANRFWGIAALFIASIALGSGAEAAYWQDECNGTDGMFSNLYIESNGTILVNLTNPISCEGLGCNNITGKCNPNSQDIDSNILMMLCAVLLSLVAVFAYIAFNAEKAYTVMGIIFITGALGILVVITGLLTFAISAGSQLWLKDVATAIYYGMILLAILTPLIFILHLIYDKTKNKEEPMIKEL